MRRPLSIFLILFSIFTLCQESIPTKAASRSSQQSNTDYRTIKSSSLNSFGSIYTYKLNYNKYKLVKGNTFVLKVRRLPSNYKVTYKSKNSRIAKVSSKGIVTGRKNGTVIIIATIKYNNLIIRNLTCKVTVGPAAISVVIPESKITLGVSEKRDLRPVIKPKYSTESPRFSSSNEKVVTVTSAGIIKGISKGTAVITVTISNNKSDTCIVTVSDKTKKKAKR